MTEEVVAVWKVPKEQIDCNHFHEVGIYPSGELMGICESEEDAEELIEHLRENSPSERFGESENPQENSMEEAPYEFTVSYPDMWEGVVRKND